MDFETRSVADLIRWGQRRYALDPSTQVLCLAWQFPEEPIDGPVHLWHRDHPWIEKGGDDTDDLIRRIRDKEPLEAHNAGFEFNIWNECLTTEFREFDVKIKLEQLHCSAAKASCMSLPRALGDAVDALGLPFKKIADGRRLINKLSKPNTRRSYRRTSVPIPERFLNPATIAGEMWIILSEIKEGDTFTAATLQSRLKKRKGRPLLETERGNTQNKVSTRAVKDGILEFDTPLFCEEEAEHRANWEYCKQDVRAERGLSDVCPEMTERERQYWMMDFRMNERGIMLDERAAKEALDLAGLEAADLNAELKAVTAGQVEKGSQRAVLLKWANGRLVELGQDTLENTKADTLSFMLDGVPTKAGDEAREAASGPSRERWNALGEEGARVERALRICMEVNRSSVAKYKQMIASVCPDHRLHDIMLYNGADRTGRWSGKGVQPHNFVRGYGGGYKNLTSDGLDEMGDAWRDILTLDRDLITLMWGEPMVCLAKACRGALIASPNKELYAADFNAIEARKLAWLSNCAVLLDLFNNKGDPYLDMATAIYERPITKADKVERQLGKKAILGLGYSMGWEKFQATVWADEGIWLEDEFCQMVVKIYRKEKYPEIPLLWRATEKAAIEAVVEGGYHYCGGDDLGFGAVCYFMSRDGNFLHCRLPSGRMLAYLYPRVNMRVTYRFAALNARGRPTTVSFPAKKSVPQHRVRWHAEKMAEKQFKTLLPDAPESFLSPHLSFTGRDTYTKQWKRCGTHGGSLVENYDQASSRDLLAEAMFYIDELPEFDLLLSIHDEVIAEAAKGTCNVGEFEALVVRGAQAKWAQGMPITAEGWIGPRLRK